MSNADGTRIRITKKHFLYALLFSALTALAHLEGSDFESWSTFLSDLIFPLFATIVCMICVYFAFNVFRAKRLAFQVVIALAAILIGSVVSVAARGISPANDMRSYVRNSMKALVSGSVLIIIFISLDRITRADALIAEEKLRRLDLEKRALETELRLLQSQTEPHFLFNSLSNVISLIGGEPEKAKNMLQDFTGFLRTSISLRQSRTVPISQELDLIRSYLGVIKTRMGSRLDYTIEADDTVLGCGIPPLLIQPLVENAVKHGIEPKTGGGVIVIRIRHEGSIIRIEVVDSGVGIDPGKSGNGIGLSNIRKRLELLYGAEWRLSISENSPSGVCAVMEMPFADN